jgi:adenylosuccinate synthase
MENHSIIVADLGFGDAGKGTMTDYLARGADSAVVVRYNGGPQAAHNVVAPDGRHHTFAQLGSASFVPGVRTHLARQMLVNPIHLQVEMDYLAAAGVDDVWQRLSIDEQALIVTPWHKAANKLRELARGDGRHGSCGQGIGETQADALDMPELALRAGELTSSAALRRKLVRLRDYKYQQLQPLLANIRSGAQLDKILAVMTDPDLVDKCAAFYGEFSDAAQIVSQDYLGELLDSHERVVFEGSQGVLLDEWFGFHPYTTWSTTTFENALTLLEEQGYEGQVTKLGVIRGYGVRHGPGPFPTEDAVLTREIPDYHNENNQWQREFRVGYLDLVLLRYALDVCHGADALAVTNLDRMFNRSGWKVAMAYETDEPTSGSAFSVADKIIRLRPGVKNDLDYQENLTHILSKSRPVYQGVSTPSGNDALVTAEDVEYYLDMISSGLGLPISYTSFGPTADDKRQLVATT